jgi:hypothetical protein
MPRHVRSQCDVHAATCCADAACSDPTPVFSPHACQGHIWGGFFMSSYCHPAPVRICHSHTLPPLSPTRPCFRPPAGGGLLDDMLQRPDCNATPICLSPTHIPNPPPPLRPPAGGGLLDDMLQRHGEPFDEDEDDNGRCARGGGGGQGRGLAWWLSGNSLWSTCEIVGGAGESWCMLFAAVCGADYRQAQLEQVCRPAPGSTRA